MSFIQYETVVRWDPDMADVNFVDADNRDLAGLANNAVKITAGIPAAIAGHWVPGAMVQNVVDGDIWRNDGTTAAPVWVLMGSGGGGGITSINGATGPAITLVGGVDISVTEAPANTFTIDYTGAGGASPLTTKGDLYTFTTLDARLPVGVNGQVLSANSAMATGLEWINAPGGGGPAAPLNSLQFNNAGVFGGSNATYVGTTINFGSPNSYSNTTGISAGVVQTQAGATQLTTEQNNVTTVVVPGDGVKLPDAIAGLSIKVINNGASDLAVYPFLGDLIDGGAVNMPVTMTPGEICTFMAISTGAWVSVCNTVVTDATLTGNGTTGDPLSVVGGGGGGLSAYGEFYQTVADVAGTIAADNGKALFQSAGANNTADFTMIAASGDITVNTTGVYEISWEITCAEAGAMSLYIGAAKQAGTCYGTGAGTQNISGSSILSLTAADVISLRSDNCPAALTLQLAGTTNTGMIVAGIMLKKLN